MDTYVEQQEGSYCVNSKAFTQSSRGMATEDTEKFLKLFLCSL